MSGEAPRRSRGEPLPIALVNSACLAEGRRDPLDTVAGTRGWLAACGHDAAPSDEQARTHLRAARTAIFATLERPGTRDAIEGLNAVLAAGHLRDRLSPGGPERELFVSEERWRVPWLAAHELLELLRRDPTRLRRCASGSCPVWFYDVSRNGTRQWCSMSSCGNREKARRHYERASEKG